jgi:DNA-directed RNA polymerase omega subunit
LSMTFMPIEVITKKVLNKYQAVMVAAKEARRINKIPKEERGEDENKRVTTLALRRLAEGKISFTLDGEKAEKR